jgi:hypothetical protein
MLRAVPGDDSDSSADEPPQSALTFRACGKGLVFDSLEFLKTIAAFGAFVFICGHGRTPISFLFYLIAR